MKRVSFETFGETFETCKIKDFINRQSVVLICMIWMIMKINTSVERNFSGEKFPGSARRRNYCISLEIIFTVIFFGISRGFVFVIELKKCLQ